MASFSLFPHLPYEIRCMIWQHCFDEPRRICLTLETVPLTAGFPFRQVLFAATGSYHQRTPALKFTSFLTCLPTLTSVAALSVHRESRELALPLYRPWKMFSKNLMYRTIMWNPSSDIIDLTRADGHIGDSLYVNTLALLYQQFPLELVEIKSLAVASTLWRPGTHKSVDVIWPLIRYTSLRHLIVVLGLEYERTLCNSTGAIGDPWNVPSDVDSNIDTLRNYFEQRGCKSRLLRAKPKVRFVNSELEIFGTQDLRMTLRCPSSELLSLLP